MQADLEEAKTREIEKLKSALQQTQQQLQETKSSVIKEQKTEKKAGEQVPVVQEVYVSDNEMVNKLTEENEQLKVSSHIFASE